jgi:peptide chain release factor 1
LSASSIWNKISLLIEGENALSFFDREIGKHCVQRVPPTEKGSRRHTSTISVSVMELREKTEYFEMRDVEVTTQRGHGKGGQNQNCVSSAVRVIHVPTSISVFINGRDQSRNKIIALEILKERVEKLFETKNKKEDSQNKRDQIDYGTRSNKVRTYNFIESRIVDHQRNVKKFTDVYKFFKKGDLSFLYFNEENN